MRLTNNGQAENTTVSDLENFQTGENWIVDIVMIFMVSLLDCGLDCSVIVCLSKYCLIFTGALFIVVFQTLFG